MQELLKDKYLALVLVIILLVGFIRTSNPTIETLLTTAVGALLGLLKAGTGNLITGGEGNVITSPPRTERVKP